MVYVQGERNRMWYRESDYRVEGMKEGVGGVES